jgi:hypothetical protein
MRFVDNRRHPAKIHLLLLVQVRKRLDWRRLDLPGIANNSEAATF